MNPGHLVLKSWFEMLNNNTFTGVPVYRTDAPAEDIDKYILLRLESSTDRRNNAKEVTNPVIITEVVTKYDTMINDEDAITIDSGIDTALRVGTRSHNLPAQNGIQIVSVSRQNQTIVPEDDGSNRWNRIITRNVHRVLQK